MLRNAAPCDPPDTGCGPPLIVQIFGPTRGITDRRQHDLDARGNGSP